ncbi:MAG: hypothetical protein J1F20_01365 [Muribaculaceae bacterium]|nr:hypothetical protein [Muribaculaceae bacterium]
MTHKLLSVLTFGIAILLASCSRDGVTGDWITSESSSSQASNLSIDSDGTVESWYDGNDGSFSIEGTWKYTDESKKTIIVQFDPSTIEADLDNPIAQAIVIRGLEIIAAETQTMTLSDDGKRLNVSGGKSYIRN